MNTPSFCKKAIQLINIVVIAACLTNCAPEETLEPSALSEQESLSENFEVLQSVTPPTLREEIIINEALTKVKEQEERFYPKMELSNARTSAFGVSDYVDFNDQMALTILPDNAKNTFAVWPYYIQQVGNAWVHVKENNETRYNSNFRSNYQHYHLGYENFNPCFQSNGQFGKPSGSNCVNFNPIYEPRELHTHAGDHWIKIYAYDYNVDSRVFDLLQIKVLDKPIQLWFKKENGGWYYWSSLGKNTWNLSNYCKSITEVLISSADGISSVSIDNVKVKVPYY